MHHGRTLILGLGNTILSDDAVGIIVGKKVCERVRETGAGFEVDFSDSSYAGWRLIDLVAQYERVIIIDAICGGGGALGDCYTIDRSDINSLHLQSSHGLGLNESLELGRQSGMAMPDHISIFAIEVKNPYEFGESLTPEVERKIPQAVEEISNAVLGICAAGAL